MRTTPFTRMDRLFDRFALPTGAHHSLSFGAGIDGNVTVETTDDGYDVVADLPGFDPEELELTLVDDGLRIEGRHDERESDHAARARTRRVHELVRLTRPVVAEEATASYRNGVLEVALPFAEPEADTGKRIDIE